MRSQSPGGGKAAVGLRIEHDPMPVDHRRKKSLAMEAQQHSGNTYGSDTWYRATHSPSSSTSSTQNERRATRSNSGTQISSIPGQAVSPPHKSAAMDASPYSSPQRSRLPSRPGSRRRLTSPTRSPTRPPPNPALTALPPLHTTPALTDPNDNDSPATNPALMTPPAHANSFARIDYFSAKETSPRTRNRPAATHIAHMQTTNSDANSRRYDADSYDHVRAAPPQRQAPSRPTTSGADRPSDEAQSRRRVRAETDKKTMLAQALQQANTAVLLDNAGNFQGALDSYSDACDLLQLVMERTSGEDDRRKLDAIKLTYSNRIDELVQLVQSNPFDEDAKDLPPRPPQQDSVTPSPIAEVPPPVAAELPAPDNAVTQPPRLPSYLHQDRDSFFSGTMAAVESSTRDNTFLWDKTPNLESGSMPTLSPPTSHEMTMTRESQPLASKSAHLALPEQGRYMPMPLSPKKPNPPSPLLEEQPDRLWKDAPSGTTPQEPLQSRPPSNESWLDTIDETASSSASSVHSVSSERGMRRKHIRGTSGNTDPDFDAAFDAAVEAAYNEGFEPDLEARRKRETAYRQQQHLDALNAQNAGEGSAADIGGEEEEMDDEEEERLLDALTHDYTQGFNFDLQAKSALPRQSDSSGYSRSTWQSSQTSDRATAATSLSTVAEDEYASLVRSGPTGLMLRSDGGVPPPPGGPPRISLPRTPGAAAQSSRISSVRNRRLSGNAKQLKIETSTKPEARKRASTFHHPGSPFHEEDELQEATMPEQSGRLGDTLQPLSSDSRHDHLLQSPASLELRSASSDVTSKTGLTPMIEYSGYFDAASADAMPNHERPTLIRKEKSSASLKEHTGHTLLLASPDVENYPSITPMSSTFAPYVTAKRTPNPMTFQRAALPPLQSFDGQQHNGGIYLFDTTLNAVRAPTSPRSPNLPTQPTPLEPCPESFLLRPFWLMRNLGSSITHPRGSFVTTRLFIAREVWQTRGVKLKLVEDKVANCDLLTAALQRLGAVDTYDADAIADELTNFEEVLDRVQTALSKKLGNEVGVHGAAASFKDAPAMSSSSAADGANSGDSSAFDKAHKSNSGKSYLSSWRKLRSKSSGAPISSSSTAGSGHKGIRSPAERDQHSIPSVPMTSFIPVERRGLKRAAAGNPGYAFDGPNREYMSSLARLFEGVQVLDHIARQVEDPGLKHSSQTHVGLELSIRHAAEFFSFYICRFVLADLGLLLDKFLKRGSEWVVA